MYHKDLEVYKQSIKFVSMIYTITSKFPQNETYGLISQLRKAAISIPSNIAEGCARYTDKQTLNFVNMAIGSLAEIEVQLDIAIVLNYLDNLSIIEEDFNKLKSLLPGFKKYIETKVNNT